MIGLGLYVTFASRAYRGPSPLYFEYVLWPYCALAAVYGLYAVGRLGVAAAVGVPAWESAPRP